LLPAALQGFNLDKILDGAKQIDAVTRAKNVKANPAMQLALAFYDSGNGKGTKNMVILPYKDRLELFSKYLQQLVMESLGKQQDLKGNVVNQGIMVLGNKGSTDQHSYVQQLRDGINNFFVVFISVLKDGSDHNLMVENDTSVGDFLNGFYLGTRQALAEGGRESLTITIDEASEFTVGLLIALFERAVGFYASLVGINAYHQPGVEAGKKAASQIIDIQWKILANLQKNHNLFTVEEISQLIGNKDDIETVFQVIQHLTANGRLTATKGDSGTKYRLG
jgi:glucose-6-phosphate isomerase